MVLGVDACSSGWVGVVLAPGRAELVHGRTFADVVTAAEACVPIAVIGVDIPVGLPVAGRRQADDLARQALGRKGSSVFPTAVREAYLALTHAEATAISVALTGKGLSQQAWRLGPKVLEVEAWVRSTRREVIEVHPELSFVRMAGAPVLSGKKTWAGQRARVALLRGQGIGLPRDRGAGRWAAPDDVLDAAAAAWSARRYAEGLATSLPSPPEVVANGVRAAIWT